MRVHHLGQRRAAGAHKVADGADYEGARAPFFCSTCAATKQSDVPHPRVKEELTTAPLELVWSDLAGPFPPSLLHGNKYVVAFVDDFTEMKFFYFIRQKSDALHAFRKFLADVRAVLPSADPLTRFQSLADPARVRVLRTDCGGEYVGKAFKALEEAMFV